MYLDDDATCLNWVQRLQENSSTLDPPYHQCRLTPKQGENMCAALQLTPKQGELDMRAALQLTPKQGKLDMWAALQEAIQMGR